MLKIICRRQKTSDNLPSMQRFNHQSYPYFPLVYIASILPQVLEFMNICYFVWYLVTSSLILSNNFEKITSQEKNENWPNWVIEKPKVGHRNLPDYLKTIYSYFQAPRWECVLENNFFISYPKHMLWVLKRTVSMRRFFKRTVSMRRFFWAPKTHVLIDQ